jgi:hypothetical protein
MQRKGCSCRFTCNPRTRRYSPREIMIRALSIIVCATLIAGCAGAPKQQVKKISAQVEEIIFPDDERAVLNVMKEFGAKGDGVADDTDALQNAIEQIGKGQYNRFIYLPNGTYRITRPLIFKGPGDAVQGSMIGPWVYGQSRDRTIIKLDDRLERFADPAKPLEMIRGISRPDGATMNADFFDRTIVNLTLDAGDNPGAVGIKFYSNNTGIVRNVLIRGNGAVGLDMGSNNQNGPLLIQDVEIDGFAVGVSTAHIINSQTMSRIRIRNAREVGLRHAQQVLAVEGLEVIGSPVAVTSTRGLLTLVDCRFEAGGAAAGAAIQLSDGHLYAARIQTSGFTKAIESDSPAGAVQGNQVDEYSSHEPIVMGAAPGRGLGITPEREPFVPWPTRAENWVCANDFGARVGDDQDDAPAFQAAIDEAARRGASTVYILGGRHEPNWYFLRQNVRVHGSVQRIMGFGFVRILGGESSDPNYPENLGKFVVDDDPDGPKVVIFEHLNVFSPVPSFGIEARSPNRVVVCRNVGATPIARENTTLFMTNVVGHAYQFAGSKVFARQWNTEHGPSKMRINTLNDGGQLWVLCMKTEAVSIKTATRNGGRTEILGVLNYNYTGTETDEPALLVENASMSVTGYREVTFTGKWWRVPVIVRIGEQELRHRREEWQTWSLLRAGGDE